MPADPTLLGTILALRPEALPAPLRGLAHRLRQAAIGHGCERGRGYGIGYSHGYGDIKRTSSHHEPLNSRASDD